MITGTPPGRFGVISWGPFDESPPAITVAASLAGMGWDVTVMSSSCAAEVRDYVSRPNLRIRTVSARAPGTLAGKAAAALRFRRMVRGIWQRGGIDRWWVVNPQSAILAGGMLKRADYCFHMLELEERGWAHWACSTYASRARVVVVPDAIRAAILRSRYRLRETPQVVHNKYTVAEMRPRREIANRSARERLAGVAPGKKILLYQGVLSRERNLGVLARVMNEQQARWQFVVMGPDCGVLPELRAACPSLIELEPIPAPFHLDVTSHAYAGVVSYDYGCLNSIFCAPNKIFEYAAFGLPMLCSDVPGLVHTVGRMGAGVCCDFDSPESIAAALSEIEAGYPAFQEGARRLYASAEPAAEIAKIVEGWGGDPAEGPPGKPPTFAVR